VRRLRILSAGCASGEEAYSLAILLHRHAAALAGWAVEVVGVDANRDFLARAASARYSHWSLRETPPDVRARHFRAEGGDFVLDDAIRHAVVFEERNLVDDDPAFWHAQTFDVVFCRNVTMYFTAEATRRLIARIAGALAPGGFLFLGFAETLRGVPDAFHLVHTHDTFYYRRRSIVDAREPWSGTCMPAPAATPFPEWYDAIQRATERIGMLARRPADAGRAHDAATATPAPALVGVLGLVREERFADAMEELRALPPPSRTDPDVQLLHAVLLTNRGELREAEDVCRGLLERNELNAGAHYLLALCRAQAGDPVGAVDHAQSAAYLDPTFAMPHVHLGLLARRTGDLRTARRELEHASALLGREDAGRILLFGGGFTRRALVDLCRAELAACERATRASPP